MNLVYLHSKNHPALTLQSAKVAEIEHDGMIWRGFRLSASNEPQIRIKGATGYHPLRTRPSTIGWHLVTGTAEVSFVRADGSRWASRRVVSAGGALEPVFLPWTLTDDRPQGEYDLTLHAPHGALIVTGTIPDRQELVALCRGDGIEIGPGPQPRVKNSETVRVKYLEKSPAEDWQRLYNSHGQRSVDPSHWHNYIVGKAHDLPVDDRSLDFIFSCHVFEHLANPLGHLERWARKLKPGGQIVTIVPDYKGTLDWLASPATAAEFMAEHRTDSFEVTREHHRRYAEAQGRHDGGEKSWARGASVHCHAYDRQNTMALLDLARDMFGYCERYIVQPTNFKEFYWRLVL
jgi:SAM-dependent methyltransferase